MSRRNVDEALSELREAVKSGRQDRIELLRKFVHNLNTKFSDFKKEEFFNYHKGDIAELALRGEDFEFCTELEGLGFDTPSSFTLLDLLESPDLNYRQKIFLWERAPRAGFVEFQSEQDSESAIGAAKILYNSAMIDAENKMLNDALAAKDFESATAVTENSQVLPNKDELSEKIRTIKARHEQEHNKKDRDRKVATTFSRRSRTPCKTKSSKTKTTSNSSSTLIRNRKSF